MEYKGENKTEIEQKCKYFRKLLNDDSTLQSNEDLIKDGVDDLSNFSSKEYYRTVITLDNEKNKQKHTVPQFADKDSGVSAKHLGAIGGDVNASISPESDAKLMPKQENGINNHQRIIEQYNDNSKTEDSISAKETDLCKDNDTKIGTRRRQKQ